MNKILKRDEYINEVYNPIKEEKEYEDLKMINEGLLKTLFGMTKNLFKKDWDSIKGDPQIIKVYKELDDELSGFSVMKLSKKSECNKIRQALVDFAEDWYEYKMNKAKEDKEDPKPAKSMKFKNSTLRENLEACESKIKDIAKDDEQMKKWADTLLRDMKTVINKSIYDEIKDEELQKELDKQFEEEAKKQKEINKEMETWQNDQLKTVQNERHNLIEEAGADPKLIKEDILGDKAIQNICGEFDKFRKVNASERPELMKNDKMMGLNKLFTEDDYSTKEFKTSYNLMNSFYTSLIDNEIMDKFKETPGQSVQAMCIAVNAFIKNCVFGGTDYGDSLPLMAKCAVISNGLISYNLPLNDKEGDEAGNYFTDIVAIITRGELKNVDGKEKGKPIKLPDDFKNNSKTLLNKIKSEADKLKDNAEKKYNEQLKRLKNEKES